MPSIISLVNKLRTDFPQFQFVTSDQFKWSPAKSTIVYDSVSNDVTSLLHEVSHAVLNHDSYAKDVQLIEMERDAWEHARGILGPLYAIPIDEGIIQASMDTYRDWLHSRSICPNCDATGVQVKKNMYRCVACNALWIVNDARICALRRYSLKNNPS